MGACGRIVTALLFLLWSSVGTVVAGSGGERSEDATRGAYARTSSTHRESEARDDHGSVRDPASGSDDSVPAVVVARGRALAWESTRTGVGAGSEFGRRKGGPLAGRPRGPPAV